MLEEYQWAKEIGTFSGYTAEQADEFIHYMSEPTNFEGSELRFYRRKRDATTGPFTEIKFALDGSEVDTVLLFAILESGFYLAAAGKESPKDDLIDTLSRTVHNAIERIGSEGQTHKWSALLGPPAERIGGGPSRLLEPGSVGPLRLESSEITFKEPDTSHQADFSAWSIHTSVPIIVRGESRGYSWEGAASSKAAADLHKLCGLLAICTGTPMTVRGMAKPLEHGPNSVPTRPPWYKGTIEDDGTSPSPDTVRGFALPDWIGPAWHQLDKYPYLRKCLSAFSEGLTASRRHPSMAAVAFTTVIESIASRLYKLPRCDECKSKSGLAKAFKAAIDEFIPGPERDAISDMYKLRSKTVHEGDLFGEETTPGVIFRGGIWGPLDESLKFRWGQLSKLEDAAQSILHWALTNEIPSRRELPSD